MPGLPSTIRVSTAIADVRRQFGDLDSIQITDTDIIAWINQGCRDIVNTNPVNEAETSSATVAGVPGYALPADLYRTETVVVGGRVLELSSFEQAMTNFGTDTTRPGQPTTWWTRGNNLFMYPVPDKAYGLVVYYNRAPNTVSSPGDLIPLPDNYYTALLAFVLSKAYELDEETELVATQVNLYQQAVRTIDNKQYPSTGSYPIIRDTEYEDYGWV